MACKLEIDELYGVQENIETLSTLFISLDSSSSTQPLDWEKEFFHTSTIYRLKGNKEAILKKIYHEWDGTMSPPYSFLMDKNARLIEPFLGFVDKNELQLIIQKLAH